jgi:hypothetical protein
MKSLTNVQCKVIWNCPSESPLYNEYILIKVEKNSNNNNKKKYITTLSFLALEKLSIKSMLKEKSNNKYDNLK